MIVLNTVADLLRVTPSAATAIDVLVSFVDTTTTTTVSGRTRTNIAAAATTTVVAAPGAGVERVIKHATFNAKGGANNLIVFWTDGTVAQLLGGAAGVPLAAGDTLIYTDTEGWRVQDINGSIKFLTSATIAGHVIKANGVAVTQRPNLDFIDTATVGFTTTDNGVNTSSEVRGAIVAHSVTAALQTQMAANTIKGEATGALADEQNIAMAVQTALIRSAANIVAAAATAGQVLGRTAAGGNLGFITPPGALLRAPQIVTATNAAFAHPAGTNLLVVQGVGGGGAGGGAAATAGACGSGGNAGNWGIKTFTSISGTSNITIGAAGTGVSAAAGNNGGNSSFVHNAITLTVPGGIGGTILAPAGTNVSGVENAGNAANTGADLSLTGELGEVCSRPSAATSAAAGGDGGSGPLGAGGRGKKFVTANGNPGQGFGAGGGGAADIATTAGTGGAGTAGAFIVWEFG